MDENNYQSQDKVEFLEFKLERSSSLPQARGHKEKSHNNQQINNFEMTKGQSGHLLGWDRGNDWKRKV
ncbi:MAG: hypothetical protein WAU36_07935 [Cyclobacteriaceae bacterium]